MNELLWPAYDGPDDLAAVETVPLGGRGLPATTYEIVARAARLWPERVALSVLPDAERWEHPADRTFATLGGDLDYVKERKAFGQTSSNSSPTTGRSSDRRRGVTCINAGSTVRGAAPGPHALARL